MATKGPTRQHHEIASGGGEKGGSTGKPSTRFYGEGGFVKSGNLAHTTKGAPAGYASRVSGGKKK